MAEPLPDSAAPRPRLSIQLSLRWKAFWVLLLLLGVVHAFYGAFAYQQSVDAYRRDEGERLAGARQMFDGLLRQSAQGLGRIAAQIAASTSVDELAGKALDSGRISPELMANLSEVQIFDMRGVRLGGYNPSSAASLPALPRDRLLAQVQRLHRPAAILWCQDECIQFVVEPAFDRRGREILIGLGQPASETLQAFFRQTGVDIALLSDAATAADTLFHRRLFAVTNAPSLLPQLRTAAAQVPSPPVDQAFPVHAGSASLMLLWSPLSTGTQNHVYALLVVDESLALQRIRQSLRNGIAISLGGLLLSSAVLWWFLTPLSKRLQVITQALPMLADKRFRDARSLLGADGKAPHLTDEIDLLTANARWLAQRLEQLDNAEAASAAKSRFLATLSHEVRTPLHGILGLLEVLQHSHLDGGQRDSIRMVHDSAQSLLRVLDDTLDLARIEAGRIDLEHAPFSIEQVLAGCAETAAAGARAKNLKLVVYTDPGLPQQVLGDAMRLRQVLGNLCSNAVKFTAAGRVVVRAELHGRIGSAVRVRFSVLDTGIGIPAEVQQALFQPFQQGGSNTASRYGGSGLGLSICDGLVRRMGGRIGLVSNPGASTEFSFWLEFPVAAISTVEPAPSLAGVDIEVGIAEPDERDWIVDYLRSAGARIRRGASLKLREEGNIGLVLEGGPPPPVRLAYPVHRSALLRALADAVGLGESTRVQTLPEAPAHRLRILAVDDHPTNREVILRQLGLLGHDAAAAASGPAALQLLAASRYDLLLTDLRMPGMDGYQLVGEIRRLEDSGELPGHLPVIALSAQPAAGETQHCVAVGMDGCLSKPIGLEGLRQALSRWSGDTAQAMPQAGINNTVTEEPVIDRSAFARLVGGDEALVEQLLRDFLEINAPLVAALPGLAAAPDGEALADAAHRLLGSARTAKAAPLARALATLESAAHKRPHEGLADLLAAVQREFERVRAQLDAVSA